MMDDEGIENNPAESSEEKDSASDAATEPSSEVEKKELTPEQQMAQFEEALKDEDWGHQPC